MPSATCQIRKVRAFSVLSVSRSAVPLCLGDGVDVSFGTSDVARCDGDVKRAGRSRDVEKARPLGEEIAGLFFICDNKVVVVFVAVMAVVVVAITVTVGLFFICVTGW